MKEGMEWERFSRGDAETRRGAVKCYSDVWIATKITEITKKILVGSHRLMTFPLCGGTGGAVPSSGLFCGREAICSAAAQFPPGDGFFDVPMNLLSRLLYGE